MVATGAGVDQATTPSSTAVPEGARWWPAALITFALLWAIMATWSLGLPRFAGPDEPAHAQKAAGVVRDGIGTGGPIDGMTPKARRVTVPVAYVATDPLCYAFNPTQPASCQMFPAVDGDTVTGTTAGLYPPAYYVLVGWPSLLDDGYRGIWLLRLASAGLAALALSVAYTLARRNREAGGVLGLLLATTPMVVFLGGIVNPNGFEIAAAMATWVGALILLRPGTEGIDRAVLWLTTAAAVGLVLSRILTPAWLVVILASAVIVGGRARAKAVLRDSHGRLALGVVGVSVLVQVVWIVGSGLATVDDPAYALDEPLTDTARTVLGREQWWLEQMIGNFGWLDTPAPLLTYALWLLLAGGLTLLAALVVPRRTVAVLGGLAALAVTLPVVLELQSAATSGLVWQGRYLLPIVTGLPIVAGFTLARSRYGPLLDTARSRWLVGGAVALAQVVAYAWALRRYSVGSAGGLAIWSSTAWAPPGGVLPLLVVHAALWVAFVWWTLRPSPTPLVRAG